MPYHLYNTNTQQIVWTADPPDAYIQNGNVNSLVNGIVEVLSVQEPEPTGLYPFQILEPTQTINLETKTLTKGWNIIQTIPPEVPLWAFRSIMTLSGLDTQITTLISGLPEPQKTIADIQWKYGNYIERNHELINTLGATIGLLSADIDNVFIAASRLK